MVVPYNLWLNAGNVLPQIVAEVLNGRAVDERVCGILYIIGQAVKDLV